MRLISLSVENLRILESVQASTDADLVVFTGLNGSGKTSLLEAIHLLGTGRSFRSHTIADVLRRQTRTLLVRGQVRGNQDRESTVGVEKTHRGATRFRINNEEIRTTSALAHHLPMVVVTPDSQRILTDGADIRRKLLDWLMFHVEPDYNQLHQRFRRALRQRNSALRQSPAGNHQIWNDELGITGQAMHELRIRHIPDALQVLAGVLADLLEIPIRIEYQPGWNTDEELASVLANSWQQDCQRGYTSQGPQRADLVFWSAGSKARQVLSRGESKLLTVAILIGLSRLLARTIGRTPLLLVDELASELDHENRARFFNALKATGAQVFVTTVSEELVSAAGWGRVLFYQAVQGKLQEVLK